MQLKTKEAIGMTNEKTIGVYLAGKMGQISTFNSNASIPNTISHTHSP